MNVKDTLRAIRKTDERLAESRRALAAAEERKTALEENLSAALAEGREPAPKDWERAGAAAVEVESRKRALARLEQDRGRLIQELIEARAEELRQQAEAAEREVARMEGEAFEHLQRAGAALGINTPVPLALILSFGGLVPSDPRAVGGFGDHFWTVDGSRWAELCAQAKQLRDQADRILNHPVHRQEEIARLLGEEVAQNA